MNAVEKFEEALKLIEPYNQVMLILGTGGKSEQTILAGEILLGVKFPPSYKKFLARFGCLAFMGMEFYGLVNEYLSLEKEAGNMLIGKIIKMRKDKYLSNQQLLPFELLVISDLGDGAYYCIDTRTINQEKESPIVLWTPGENEIGDELEVIDEDYGSFFLRIVKERIKDYKEYEE